LPHRSAAAAGARRGRPAEGGRELAVRFSRLEKRAKLERRASRLERQALLSVLRARAADRRRSDAQARSTEAHAALSEIAIRERRRSAACRTGYRQRDGRAGPGHARDTLCDGVARFGAGLAEDARDEPRCERRARARQGREGASRAARRGGGALDLALPEGGEGWAQG